MLLKSGNTFASKLATALLIEHGKVSIKNVDVFAHPDNENTIYIGGFDTCAETRKEKGWPLAPGDVFSVSIEGSDSDDETLFLSQIFIAAKNAGDYVTWGARI